jgi:hypothetical protein
MIEPAATNEEQPTEQQRVVDRRFDEARSAGLTLVEARLFAESDADVGQLRKLAASGCPAAQIAAILI